MRLNGKVALITGSSRGLGKAMALAFAREGAAIVVVARTEQVTNPDLPGTIHQTVEEIRAAGGRAIAVRADAAQESELEAAVARGVEEFGRLDIVVHDAGAASHIGLTETSLRRWDVLFGLNVRAAFVLLKAALPHLQAAGGGHFLVVSPKLTPNLSRGVAYGVSKQAATLFVTNVAQELLELNVAANCIWPATGRDTEGMRVLRFQDPAILKSPRLFADAALEIVAKEPKEFTGRSVTDEEVLAMEGITDLSVYAKGT